MWEKGKTQTMFQGPLRFHIVEMICLDRRKQRLQGGNYWECKTCAEGIGGGDVGIALKEGLEE